MFCKRITINYGNLIVQQTVTPMAQENLVVKYLHGVPIRIHNKIYLNLHYSEYEKFIEQAHQFGLSIAQIIRLSSGPCQKCGHNKVEICLPSMSTNKVKQGFTLLKKWDTNENNH